MSGIAKNLENVRQRMRDAARDARRDPSSIGLIAVSKGKSEEDVRTAIAAGQRVFAENRVQEAEKKFVGLRGSTLSHDQKNEQGLELHLIGPLQTNKAEDAVRIFDVIQTLDRPRLAEALVKAVKKVGCTPKFYIEVNIGDEPQKTGVDAAGLGAFLKYCRETCGLKVSGLMCVPPQGKDPTPYFLKLKELSALYNLPHLSMGMSADFEEAVTCGATEVRIGSAIFGGR